MAPPFEAPAQITPVERMDEFRQLLFRRFHPFLDVGSAGLILLVLFTTTNLNHMPQGIDEFLAMRLTVKNVVLMGLFAVVWTTIFRLCGLYDSQKLGSLGEEVWRIVRACSVASLFLLFFPLASNSGSFSYDLAFYFWPLSMAFSVVGRFLVRGVATYCESNPERLRNVIIVGTGPRGAELYREIQKNHSRKYHVLGFVDTVGDQVVAPEVRECLLGSLGDLESLLATQVVDQVFITLPIKSCYDEVQQTIRTCETVGVESKFFLEDVFELSLARLKYEPQRGSSVVSLKVVQDDFPILIKRGIDIVGSLCALIFFAPLMLLIAAAIKLTSSGPIIFAQERFGLQKRRFNMYKFRTMVQNAGALQAALEAKNEANGPVFKIRNDPRITPLGRLLRKTSLDELPQLWNVLRGEMSLVGPRPLPTRDVSRFDETWLMRRFSVRPGLTCLWQVGGRSGVDFDRWIELDLNYIDNWSLWLDLRILLLTVPAVLKGEGAA